MKEATASPKDVALKLALDLAIMHHSDDGYAELRSKVRQLAKEALALTSTPCEVQPEQELVGFIESKADNECADAYADGWNACVHAHKDTTPPKRPWVGLTDDEASWCQAPSTIQTWKRIEAKLKEKNT